MSRIAGRFMRVEPRRRAIQLTRAAVGPAARELLDHRRTGRGGHAGRHAAPAGAGQVGRRPGTRRPARVRGGVPARRAGGAGGRRDRGPEEGHRRGRCPTPVHRHRGQERECPGRRLPGLHGPARARRSGPRTVRPALLCLRPRPRPRPLPGRRTRPGHRVRDQAGTGHPHDHPVLDAGHHAPWVTGDEVYGGNPKLRTALEERGTGYVLTVACSHQVTTQAGKFRADTLARKLPRRAWQKLSAGAGAKGHRFYDWAAIGLPDPAPGSRRLLIRRNCTTGELTYYRCCSPPARWVTWRVRGRSSRGR